MIEKNTSLSSMERTNINQQIVHFNHLVLYGGKYVQQDQRGARSRIHRCDV